MTTRTTRTIKSSFGVLGVVLTMAGCAPHPYDGPGAELVGRWLEDGSCDSEDVSCSNSIVFGDAGGFSQEFLATRTTTAVMFAGCTISQRTEGLSWEVSGSTLTVLTTSSTTSTNTLTGCVNRAENGTVISPPRAAGEVVHEGPYDVTGNVLAFDFAGPGFPATFTRQ